MGKTFEQDDLKKELRTLKMRIEKDLETHRGMSKRITEINKLLNTVSTMERISNSPYFRNYNDGKPERSLGSAFNYMGQSCFKYPGCYKRKHPEPKLVKPIRKSKVTSKNFSNNTFIPRCVKCDDYPQYPKRKRCFYCLKMSLNEDTCKVINETGPRKGKQCHYKPYEGGRCNKHNEEHIDVMRSSDEDYTDEDEEDLSLVVSDHSSSNASLESSDEFVESSDEKQELPPNKKRRRY